MLDFEKVDATQFNELKTTIQKSVEKSDLDRYYLFSTDKFIKAKLFILCYRFLLNAWNLTGAGGLKQELENEIKYLAPVYEKISYLLNYLDSGRKYGKHLITEQLFFEVNKQQVTDLIDIFAILTERVNIISMSKFKAVIMEGKSGDEFNKIMRGDEKRRYGDGETEIEEETLAPVDEYVGQRRPEPEEEPEQQEEQEEEDAEQQEEIEEEQDAEEEVEVAEEPLEGMSSTGAKIKEEWKSPEDDTQEPLEPEEK